MKMLSACLFGALEFVFLCKQREDLAVWKKTRRGFGNTSFGHEGFPEINSALRVFSVTNGGRKEQTNFLHLLIFSITHNSTELGLKWDTVLLTVSYYGVVF